MGWNNPRKKKSIQLLENIARKEKKKKIYAMTVILTFIILFPLPLPFPPRYGAYALNFWSIHDKSV